MNPVTLLLGGGWKYLAAAAAVAGTCASLTTTAYHRGVDHERRVWTERQHRADAEAATLAQTRQTARDQALTAAAARASRYAQTRALQNQKVIRYVQSPAAAIACPDADGMRLGGAAIDAANLALTAR